jgi:hypothetical protein
MRQRWTELLSPQQDGGADAITCVRAGSFGATGTPRQVADNDDSVTGACLGELNLQARTE